MTTAFRLKHEHVARTTGHEGGRIAFDKARRCSVWRCYVYGKQEHWREGWWWYGNWAAAENGNILVACSERCTEDLARIIGVPMRYIIDP